jgi:hypothetical protein
MAKRIASTLGIIDWKSVIDSFTPKSGDFNNPASVMERSSMDPIVLADCDLTSSYVKIMDTWRRAKYDLKNIQWYDYYPGEHYDIEVQTKFADLVGADPRRVFISEVWPGHCVPYHWDVEDHEAEWLKEGLLVRYVCFIEPTNMFGHALILEDECFYNITEHEVYQWDDHKSFHAGTNAGEFPYYLFHFLGTPR